MTVRISLFYLIPDFKVTFFFIFRHRKDTSKLRSNDHIVQTVFYRTFKARHEQRTLDFVMNLFLILDHVLKYFNSLWF